MTKHTLIEYYNRGHDPLRRTREYKAWAAMIQRCTNPNCANYIRYGARGIKVCKRWRSFDNFIADVGKRPSKEHSLDRIDNMGHYEPGNVRWSTRKQQMRNMRRNHIVLFRGKNMTITEACGLANISVGTVKQRLKLGWTFEEAFTPPLWRGPNAL